MVRLDFVVFGFEQLHMVGKKIEGMTNVRFSLLLKVNVHHLFT